MFQIIILNLFLILPLAVSAQNLIPHVGNSCPTRALLLGELLQAHQQF